MKLTSKRLKLAYAKVKMKIWRNYMQVSKFDLCI